MKKEQCVGGLLLLLLDPEKDLRQSAMQEKSHNS